MLRKMGISFLAVLCGFLSLGYVKANQHEYKPVAPSPDQFAAFINEIYESEGTIRIKADFIDWYEGEAANVVFREREQDPEMTEAPDGYYIVNDDPTERDLELAIDAEVLMQYYDRTGNPEEADVVWNEPIDTARFVALFADEDAVISIRDYPYHLKLSGDRVVGITQQFLP